jgi:photosystem II stability/assembly factor-like uncharacterized protein
MTARSLRCRSYALGGSEFQPPPPPSTVNRTWTAGNTGGTPAFNLEGVAANADGSIMVAGGVSQSVYVSTDFGVTWTEEATGRGSDYTQAPAYGDGQFFLGGIIGPALWASPDGVTWTRLTNSLPDSYNDTAYFTYGNGIWLGAPQGGVLIKYYMASSNGGTTWANSNADSTGRNYFNTASGFDGSQFFAAGFTSANGQIATSSDGLNWTVQASFTVASLFDPEFMVGDANLGLYVLGNTGAQYTVASTPAGLASATPQTMPDEHSGGAWAWAQMAILADGTIIAFSTDGTIMFSTNAGVSWTADVPAWSYGSHQAFPVGVFAGTNIVAALDDSTVAVRGVNC